MMKGAVQMAENVKGLSIKLGLDTTELQKGISNTYKSLKKLNNLQKTFNKISIAVTGVGTALLATATKVSSAINEIEDASSQAGVAFESWQKLEFAMDQIGVQSATTSTAMAKMNSAIGKISDGSGKNLIKILNQLGIDYKEFVQLSPDEAFYLLNDALGKVDDQATRLSYMSEFFGDKLTTKLLPAVDAGSEALKNIGDNAVIFTAEQATLAKQTETLNKQIKQTATSILATLLPAINGVLSKFKELIERVAPKVQNFLNKFNNLSDKTKSLIKVIAGISVALAPILKIATSIYKIVGISLPKALLAIQAHPIIATITAVVTTMTILYTQCEEFKKLVDDLFDSLMEVLKPLLSILKSALEPLFEIIKTIGTLLANLFGGILKPIVALLNGLLPILKPIVEFLNVTLVPILEFINTLLEGIAKLLKIVTFGLIDFTRESKGLTDSVTQLNDGENAKDPELWNTNVVHLARKASNRQSAIASQQDGKTSSGNTTENIVKNFYITINTSKDHMSIDELDSKLGMAF